MKKLIVSMLVMIMIFCLTGLSSAECNGPFTYEQMNRDHKSIFNEFQKYNARIKKDTVADNPLVVISK